MNLSLIRVVSLILLTGQITNSHAQKLDSSKQQSLRYLVNNVKKPGFYPNRLFNYERKYYDAGMKKQLLDVVANQWTTEELEAWVQNDLSRSISKEYIESDARRIAEAGKMIYEKAVDSLRAVKILWIRKQLEEKPVNPDIILAVAWLDLQEAVPILKQALNDKMHYDSATVHLALARLQVEPYHRATIQRYLVPVKSRDYRIDSLRDYYARSPSLLFICSQESVYAVSRWLYSKAKENPLSDGNLLVPLNYFAVSDLSSIVTNVDFRRGINMERYEADIDYFRVTPEIVVFTRNWIKANKGKFQLNRDRFIRPITR